MRTRLDTALARCLLLGTAGILALMPFHAFLTVWVAQLGLNYTTVRLWKEFVLVALALVALVLVWRSADLRAALMGQRIIRYVMILIGLYTLLHLLAGASALLSGRVTAFALGYGVIGNLRFLLFFLIALVAGLYHRDWVTRHWPKLLLIPAVVVIGFGLLQQFVLPVDVLRIVGYGPETIAPYIAVDNKVEYARVQSTLRGPNPLGAYLVLVLTGVLALALGRWRAMSGKMMVLLLGVGFVVLYGTHSRSAWLGLLAAVGIMAWLAIRSQRTRRLFAVGGIALLVLGTGTIWLLRDQDVVQNVVFHTDENSLSAVSSNEQRANAMVYALQDIVKAPLGSGPGTAGPASVYNDGRVRISENYFLQLGQEVGVFAVMVFVAIHALLAGELWRRRQVLAPLPVVLLASLAGLVVVNMVSHAWMDDTLAYMWWGMAGLAAGAVSVKTFLTSVKGS